MVLQSNLAGVIEESTWTQGARTLVDVSRATCGAVEKMPSQRGAAGEPLRSMPPGGGGALVVARALSALKDAAVFTLDISKDGRGVYSETGSKDLVAELAALPAVVREAILSATLGGTVHLKAALSDPLAVLAAFLASDAPVARDSVLLFRTLDSLSSVISHDAAGGRAAGGRTSAEDSITLSDFRTIACAWAPTSSLDVLDGVIRSYPMRRSGFLRPPRLVPAALYNEYTVNGTVLLDDVYVNDATEVGGEARVVTYTKKKIDDWKQKVRLRESNYYGVTDQYLYKVLERHPDLVRGKRVVVLGSLEPWFEIVALEFGSAGIFTVEYGGRASEDAAFHFITPSDMEAQFAAGTWKPFDVAMSISSYEHDGLGRYGDPLNGEADLRSMELVRDKVLKPGGHLLFTVPIGDDCIVYNAHRVYGSKRLPLMERGWTRVDAEGSAGSDINQIIARTLTSPDKCDWEQPIFLLKNQRT
jgi:hypothetical protein